MSLNPTNNLCTHYDYFHIVIKPGGGLIVEDDCTSQSYILTNMYT